MSVINQVLNQLEQRGAHAEPEQSMVRAVPNSKRNKAVWPLLLFGLIAVIGLVVWQWLGMKAGPENTVPRATGIGAGGKEQLVAAKPVPAGLTKPPVPQLPKAEPPAPAAPASRLSFNLSSVPLPSSHHNGEAVSSASLPRPEQNTSGQQQIRAAAMMPTPLPSATELPKKQISKTQQADAEFRRASELMQQGRISDAIAGYEAALKLDAAHLAARQALVALLLEGKRGAEAERVLQAGLDGKPEQAGFAMLLARLQVERGALDPAVATLEKSLAYAENQADYQAFFAALLQRQNRHKEAITHYQIALQLSPGNGVWMMGLGISMQAIQRNDEANNAFKRALESQTLSPELQRFVRQQIR